MPLILGMWAIYLTLLAGWINNVFWTFEQSGWGIALGALGALVFPIGAIHGIYQWFA